MNVNATTSEKKLDLKMNKVHNSLSFCVVVPMLNEEKNAESCVCKICEFLEKLDLVCSMVAVDDGSSDQTLKKLKNLQKKYKNLFVKSHKNNRGYGAANATGGKFVIEKNYKYALFMDADLTQDVKYIHDFIELMKRNIDYIKATRYSKGGGQDGVEWSRRLVSRVGNLIAKIFLRLPISDYTNGFRAVKSQILAQIKQEDTGFSYLIEEVTKVSKIATTFDEVPYKLSVRQQEHSKSKFTYSFSVYLSYLKWVIKK